MAQKNNVASEATKTLDALFFDRVRRLSATVAYREYDKKRREWRSVSWAALGLEMTRWRGALEREELDESDRVAIMLPNCKEWVIFDQAAIVQDLVTVPIYPNESLDNTAFIIHDSAAKILLIQDLAAWQKLAPIHSRLGNLQRIILLEVRDDQEEEVKALGDERIVIAKDWLPVEGGPLHERYSDSNTVCTIVYTSGTTGQPKGVMLTHLNLLTNARAVMQMYAVRQTDLCYSHLSLTHIVDRICNYIIPMMSGAVVAFGRSLEMIDHDLVELNPSIMVTESHFLTRLARKLEQDMAERVFIDRMLFKAAVKAGWANFQQEQKHVRFQPMAMFWPVLKGMSSHAIMPLLVGYRLRRVISTGTPLAPQMAELFCSMGINIMQGCHMTEATGLVSLNTVVDNYPDSIGMSIPGYKIKVGVDTQFNIGSDNSMSPGYMGEATDQPLMVGEYFHSQDSAEYRNQHLYLAGRLSEQLTIGKHQVNPELLEACIISDTLFDYAMIIGETDTLCAIVVLHRSSWNEITAKMGLEGAEANKYDTDPLRGVILNKIQKQLNKLPFPVQIATFIVSDIAWSVDEGLLTPTLRPRRHMVRKRFGPQVATAVSGLGAEAVEVFKQLENRSVKTQVSAELPTQPEVSSATLEPVLDDHDAAPAKEVKDQDIPTL
ncbi:MAG: AMP-binding protein [Gammaproteobacteria bacterium]|nr:AMP-binding protein [Gammaproteobacteria bacterium]